MRPKDTLLPQLLENHHRAKIVVAQECSPVRLRHPVEEPTASGHPGSRPTVILGSAPATVTEVLLSMVTEIYRGLCKLVAVTDDRERPSR
ncbi:MAG: hypothetical protein HY321_20425 [Armatimonadetes bacterium]|nr:hypothetical protein [Armatimonadota bacterium]